MAFSQLVRLIVVCATVWIVAPASLFASFGVSQRGRPAQIDSLLPTPPASPLAAPLDSPLPTPHPDPASGFEAFLPGVSDQAPVSVENQPPGTPPDLGTVLNTIAGAVVVIGVTLKIYWYISDRRKRAEK